MGCAPSGPEKSLDNPMSFGNQQVTMRFGNHQAKGSGNGVSQQGNNTEQKVEGVQNDTCVGGDNETKPREKEYYFDSLE